MTWTKLGDEFPAAARELTDAELRTHVEALCWSSLRLLDLHIPENDVRRFAESPDAADAVEGLAAKGWWEHRGDSWYIGLKFPEWQLERKVVEQRRNYLAEAQRRSRLHKAGDHSMCIPGGKCPHVTRDSTVESTVDARVDNTDDPGRVGSGATHPPDPEEQTQGQAHLIGASVNGFPPTPADSVANSKTASSRRTATASSGDQQNPIRPPSRAQPQTVTRTREADPAARVLAFIGRNPGCTGTAIYRVRSARIGLQKTLRQLEADGKISVDRRRSPIRYTVNGTAP